MRETFCFSLKPRSCQSSEKSDQTIIYRVVVEQLLLWPKWFAIITSRFLTNTHWVHILALRQLMRLSTQSHWITACGPNSLPLCPSRDLPVFFLGQCWCLRARTFSWKKMEATLGWGVRGARDAKLSCSLTREITVCLRQTLNLFVSPSPICKTG